MNKETEIPKQMIEMYVRAYMAGKFKRRICIELTKDEINGNIPFIVHGFPDEVNPMQVVGKGMVNVKCNMPEDELTIKLVKWEEVTEPDEYRNRIIS